MSGKFTLFKDKQGKFRFQLLARNGEIIAVGQAYNTKATCMNGINSIRKHAPEAVLVDQTSKSREEIEAEAKKRQAKKTAAKKKATATRAATKKAAAKKTAAK